MIEKLLYLTFIDTEKLPTSGSSVRPLKMKTALEQVVDDVRSFDGMNNDLSARRKTVKDINSLLKTWKPDACYIEPPSGPLFYYGDVKLIKKLHKLGVSNALFYRDAYWKYPEYYKTKKESLVSRLKSVIIKYMQVSQWRAFQKYIDVIYFPSMRMADEFKCKRKDALPPGSFMTDEKADKPVSKPLQFIFVGGAAVNHGTILTLEAFEKANKDSVIAKLFYICPKTQWDKLGIRKENYQDWLEVIHTSGDENLKRYYDRSDIALLTAPRTFYRDFAVPIKIFEYMSYLKPILVTDCIETARIVKDNQIGWVVADDVDCICNQIKELYDNIEEVESVKKKLPEARADNLWENRAKKIVADLDSLKNG